MERIADIVADSIRIGGISGGASELLPASRKFYTDLGAVKLDNPSLANVNLEKNQSNGGSGENKLNYAQYQALEDSALETTEVEDGFIKSEFVKKENAKNEQTDSVHVLQINQIWESTISLIKKDLDHQIYDAWISPLRLVGFITTDSSPTHETAIQAVIEVANRFCREHVEKHYGNLICDALSTTLNSDVKLLFRPATTSRVSLKPQASLKSVEVKQTSLTDSRSESSNNKSSSNGKQRQAPRVDSVIDHTNLNPKYSFSNFVVGTCNQFAHAACLRVSEHLGSNYNPLFIYGGVGLGKTHLANAIGNASRRRNKKVMLVSSEFFVSELIASLRNSKMPEFKNKFRSLDLLIVDDIQFIIGKERTQEEFFHTFNELYNTHKQIIITSDKIPQELVGLEERLRTRFASGLSVDLQAPDYETRVAILIKKAEAAGFQLPEEVARLVAESIDTNVRELEGALNRLQALSSLGNTKISLEAVGDIIKNMSTVRRKEVTSELVQKIVAERFNVSLTDLLGKRRTHNIAFARHIAMFLCRRLTGRSYPEIGAIFGGRDHSSVVYANKLITDRLSSDAQLRTKLEEIELFLVGRK